MTTRTRTAKPRALDEHGNPVPYDRKLKDGGPLHRLLLRACPPDPVTGAKSLSILAKKIGVSRQALDASARANSINVKRAAEIVDVADPNSGVTLADFAPFYLM